MANIGSPVNSNGTNPCVVDGGGGVSNNGIDRDGALDILGPHTRYHLGLDQHSRRQIQDPTISTVLPTSVMTADNATSMGRIFGKSGRSPPPIVAFKPKQRSCSCSSQTDLSMGSSSENLATAVAASVDGSQAPCLSNLQAMLTGRLADFAS